MRELRWLKTNRLIHYEVSDKKQGRYQLILAIEFQYPKKQDYVDQLQKGITYLETISRKTRLGEVESILHGSHTAIS